MNFERNAPAAARKIAAPDVIEPPAGTFSNCRVAGGLVFVSGQHAGSSGGAIGGASMLAQAREALRRVIALVTAAGASRADIIKLTVFVTDMSRRNEVTAARREAFREPFPCSTLVEISALAEPDLLVEIEATAVLPDSKQGSGS
ncbi:MAG TPA: RidA family protein [Beijerinckiaceae bacterium]|nr:RidA family protein [Beijerinckiaceae bacterium]